MSGLLVTQRCRSVVLNCTVRLMNLNARICPAMPEIGEIAWQDRLRWFNEGILDRIFGWAFRGSQEEVDAVYHGEIPPKYMNLWQKAILAQVPREEIDAHCCRCSWYGTLDEAAEDECPNCHKAVWIEPFRVSQDFRQ